MPNVTKKLVIDTIKRQLTVDAKTKEVKNLENVLDEISYANQLGRLDTISLLVAAFALILGFGAIAGFMHIKEVSENVAIRTSQKITDEFLENWAKSKGEADNKQVSGKAKDRGKRKAVIEEGEIVQAANEKI